MKSAQFLRKAWPHLFVVTLIAFFILVAPRIYHNLFVKQGKPVAVNVALPPETNLALLALESVDRFNAQGVYRFIGWGLLTLEPRLPAGSFDRLIVLETESGNYVFQADTTYRVDIQTVLKGLDLDAIMSGMSALIFKDSIHSGTYSIGVLFKNKVDGLEYYVHLNRCIRRTPNRFWLEDLESADCRQVTQHDGTPTQFNSALPDEITEAKYSFDLMPLEGKGVYQLLGWAFPLVNKSTPSSSYELHIVLFTPSENMIFPAQALTRADVHNYFRSLGMDLTKAGISALISQEALRDGSYGLGVIFKNITNGKEYYFKTTKCITRNSGGLVLTDIGLPDCTIPSP